MAQDKPAWQRIGPIEPHNALGYLEVATIIEAQEAAKQATQAYQEFRDAFRNLRSAIEWMYAGEHRAKKTPLPFEEVCKNHNCDPEKVRKLVLTKVPETLQRMAFHGQFDCPFIEGRKCGIAKKEIEK